MTKKVLVVDDSALVRKKLTELLDSAGYEIDSAKNGQEAVDKVLANEYHVVTMDINMPVLDGISALREIMKHNPTPVVMISSLTTEDADATFDALDLGAIDYVAKPGTMNVGLEDNANEILKKVRSASRIPKRRLKGRRSVHEKPSRISQVSLDKKHSHKGSNDIKGVVLIGSSTGGPGLIESICTSLPEDYPHPICIVQHMPEKFTSAFAQRLDKASKVNVFESEHNQELLTNGVYIAKGGSHMHFAKKVSGKIVIREGKSDTKRFFTPSIDEMFESALSVFEPKKIFAVELTGIGDDGADGMVAIKKAGGYTVAESEESATVYGMPKEAFVRGGTCEVLDFDKILQKIISFR